MKYTRKLATNTKGTGRQGIWLENSLSSPLNLDIYLEQLVCSELGFAQSLTSVPVILHCYHYVNLNYSYTK